MNRSIIFILLGVCLVLSFLLSSKMILHGDFYYLADQARDYLLVKDIIYGNHLTLVGTHSGLGGFFHGPLWLYILVPFYFIGAGNPLIFAYFYIFIAIFTVFMGFIVSSKLYSYYTGLIVAFLLALSPNTWSYVPNTIGVNMVPIVFTMMFYFLVKYIRGERYSYIYAIFFAGLSLQFETALPLIIFPIIILTYFIHKQSIKDAKLIVLSTISFCISLLTFILFDLRHNFLMSNALVKFFTIGERNAGYMDFSERLILHISSFKNIYTSVTFNNGHLLVSLGIIIVFLYLFVSKRNKNKIQKEWTYLILFPIFVAVIYLFYPYPVWPEYLLGLVVPVVFALAISINYLLHLSKFKLLPILFFLISAIYALTYIQIPYYQNPTGGSYINQLNVAKSIYRDSGDEEFSYFVYSPNTYTYGMDYLFSYLGDSKFKYMPSTTKKKNTYLIMYPHLQDDLNAYNFWKENVLHISSIPITRIEAKGEIVVEKHDLSDDAIPVDENYYQNMIFR